MAQQVVVMASLVGLGLAGIVFLTRKLKGGKKSAPIPPDHGAFVERFQILPPPHPPPPAAPLPLSGKTFAVKDIFNVEGHVTGFGNLTWAETHEPAARTAPCVKDVVKEGATLEGKTHMDDMAYSMLGASSLAGQPINPLAPLHLPGGSSSGSAVAVAAGLVDFALGTDTAGSIRIPAANCGVLGFRPTHGAISTVGVVPMAPSLDTVGLLAREPAILHQVGHTLLRQPFMARRVPLRVVIADDLFDLSSCPRAPVTETVIAVTEQFLGPVVKYLKIGDLLARSVPSLSAFAAPRGNDAAANGSKAPVGRGPAGRGVASSEGLLALAEAQRVLQRLEFRDCHGEWVARYSPALHDHVIARVRSAAEGVILPPDDATAPDPPLASSSATDTLASKPSAGAPGDSPAATENGNAGSGAGAPEGGKGVAEIEETHSEKFLRAQALKVKEELRHALNKELESDAILVLPAAPDLPLRLDAPPKALDEYRAKAMQIVAPASMSGLPQVVIPVGSIDAKGNGGRKSGGLPLAVSFMARSGADRFLLDATMLYAPVLPQAYRELMESRRSRGQDQEGKEKGAQKGQDGKKSPAEVAKDSGNAAFKEKQYGAAVEHYTEAIRLNPRNPTYYANRAMAYLNLKNMPQVEADCTAALELDKKNVKALLRRGTAREFMGMYLEAYQDFHDVMILEPTNKTALDGLRRLEQAGVLQS